MTGGTAARLRIGDAHDVESAARALASGAFVVHVFANLYALTTRGDAPTVHAANEFKGRRPGQVGSVTTTPARLTGLVDLARLPGGLRADDVLGAVDELLCLGPLGFRAPAAAHVPDHLTARDDAGRWVQVIVPGYRCPSNVFLARSLRLCATDHLHITSANRSHHLTGAEEEPPHHRASAIRDELGADPRVVVLEHDDEAAALLQYPQHAPMSTTVLGLRPGLPGRTLTLERLGSLPADAVRTVLARHGLTLAVPTGLRPLTQRVY
ncbi:hypothetical protein M3148_05080 [Georgenia satyanarayanai]|uniref:hypothetical protein n=1 Tax=Georgenia satyanarayanai TaxID=860221 RepID=UPI002041E613|nr:hypothetical protein [Georgenia satyanarayanai]MCM3660369.1 hypothetical protein [Georgenia satyanarayanai]